MSGAAENQTGVGPLSGARRLRSLDVRLAIDAVLAFGTWAIVLVGTNITPTAQRSNGQAWMMTVFVVLVTMTLLYRGRVHSSRPSLPHTDEISRVAFAVFGGATGLAVLAAFSDWRLGATELLIGCAALFVVRSLVWGIARDLLDRTSRFRRVMSVIVVGVGPEAGALCELINSHPERNVTLAGIVGNKEVAARFGLLQHHLGDTDELLGLMARGKADAAILTPTGFRSQKFEHLTQTLQGAGYDVHLSTGITRLKQGRISTISLAHEPLLILRHDTISHPARIVKRLVDLVGASVLLVLASPLMLMIAVAIKIDSRGPVFFRSPRFGRGATRFDMWKFRSMVVDAEARKSELQSDRTGPVFKVANDPRVTRVGRFIRETSLDEIPQFFNVLAGNMSLVGPRPALPAEEAAFDGEHRDRFIVRPGITGLWQVEARANASFGAYERLDLHYLENWSLGLDLAILLATAEQVAVTLCTLPLRRLLGISSVDGVNPTPVPEHAGSPEPAIEPASAPQPSTLDLRGPDEMLSTAAEQETMNGNQTEVRRSLDTVGTDLNTTD